MPSVPPAGLSNGAPAVGSTVSAPINLLITPEHEGNDSMKRFLGGWVSVAVLGVAVMSGCAENNEAGIASGTVQPETSGVTPASSAADMGKMMQKNAGGGMGAGYPGGASKSGSAPKK